MPRYTRRAVVRLAMTAACTAIAASTLAACGGSSEASSSSLTVGFVVDPSWAQVPVAEAEGYFKSEGVDVKVINFSTGVQALQALAAGQLDVTTAADVPVAAVLSGSNTMKIVADGSRWKGSVIVARSESGIKDAADLAGKSIGTPLGTSAAYFASSFLQQSDVTAQLVQADPSAMLTAMQQGNVDAVSIFQPYQQQVISALGSDAVVLKPQAGTYVQQSLYLASEDAAKNKAKALSAFFSALNLASGDLEKQTPEAVDDVASATQLSADLVKEILPEFDFTISLPTELSGQLTSLGQWALTAGNIDEGTTLPDYSTFVDPAFLPAAK